MSGNVTISKKFDFSASHRCWKEDWSTEKNQKWFGFNDSPYGHGHNYELHVTVIGSIDPQSGMIINLSELKEKVNEILDQFDHKFLNHDTPYFNDLEPTTENVARILFQLIDQKLSGYKTLLLKKIRLYERHDLYADVWRDTE